MWFLSTKELITWRLREVLFYLMTVVGEELEQDT
jgi:hypothetical protein